ncbi:MAG: hypothetical protein ACXVPK_03360 [Tumebacillaceae bacterium]
MNYSPRYCLMDLATYFMYAPFAYFFIYLYEKFAITLKCIALYIIVCSILSVGVEAVMVYFKVITYKNGWNRLDSFVVYLFTQALTIVFYHWIRKDRMDKQT